MKLTETELRDLKAGAARANLGLYVLRELVGKRTWNRHDRKTDYGRGAKEAIQAGLIPRVTWAGRTVTNHQLYRIS